jgi:hypothetical protein
MSNYPPQPPQQPQYPHQYPPPTGQPYPGQPMPYGGYAVANPRPGSVTALAIIGIVLASLALLVKSLNIMMHLTTNAAAIVGGWDLMDSVISVVLSVVLLIAGIGCLKLKPGARKLLLGWAGIYMVLLAVRLVMSVTVGIPRMLERQQAAGTVPPGFEAGAYFGAVAVLAILAVYPICVLMLLRKPAVVAAFEGQPATPTVAY